MNSNEVINQIFQMSFEDLIQWLAIIFTLLYTIFALLVVRQVQLMVRTLPSPISPFVVLLAYLHLGVTLAVLIILIGVF